MTSAAMTSTAADWISTPTPTPISTPTASATSTITSTPTNTPTPTLSPTPLGWIGPGNCGQITELNRIGDGKINQLVYSLDGRWLAAATTTGVSLYDLTTLTRVWKASTQASLDQIAFSIDSSQLVGVDPSTRIYVWQTSDGKQLLSKVPGGIQAPPTVLALSPDGSMLAVPYYDDSIHLYRTSDGVRQNKIEQFLLLGEMIYQIAYSPDGKRLATISFNGDLRLWDLDRNKLASVIKFDGVRRPYGMVFTPDGKDLGVNFETEDGEKTIRILDVYSARWQQSLQGELIVISPDTSFISKASEGIDLRDYASGSLQNTFPEQEEIQGKPAFSPDGAFLAVGTPNGIHIWRREDLTQSAVIPGEYSNYSGLAVSADGLLFAGATSAGIEIRKFNDGSLIRGLSTGTEPRPFSAIAYSSQNNLVAGASGARVYVWNIEDGNLLWSVDIDYTVNDLAFSPDGTLLAAAVSGDLLSLSENQKKIPVYVWDTTDGFLLFDLTGSEQLLMAGFSSVAFSPDGNYLLAAEENGDLDIWLVAETWKKVNIPNEELLDWNQVVAFSPDSRQFVTGGMDRQLKLWKVETRKSIKTINLSEDSITALAFSADGQMFASGISREIRLWRTNGGSIICSVKGSGGILRRIFFTPDGRFMISLADDGVVRIWGTPQETK